MNVRVRHTTTYLYREPVSICHTEVRLAPREDRSQRILEHKLSISPPPGGTFGHKDYFGNHVLYFSLHEPHQTLTISAESVIELENAEPLEPGLTPPWEEALGDAWLQEEGRGLKAYQYVFESPRITPGPEFADYARPSFPRERPLLEACLDLCHRIHADFRYDQQATTVATSVAEVFKTRRGVCQDFAHFAIAGLRSLGFAARYVSGYLRSPDLVGSQASHAWVAVFCPGFGWLGLDPTNDQLPDGNHITLAYGRDYSDVAPVKGVTLGGGEQVIDVEVLVEPAA
ncbi:MAG: transglutaminase [Terriglobia bacterium]|nr:MAG: transglutaminase [Terriglobia bacterium]